MTTATRLSTIDDFEPCILCSTKYSRARPSFCQCKHCSIPLCLDCMKEHHDDILQHVAQLPHQYNELQELIKTKQSMIVDETSNTIDDVNHYFDTYIDELRHTQQKIIEDLQGTKQDAQDYVGRVQAKLHLLGLDIQALAKESIVQITKMKNLSIEMKKIEQQLTTYQVMRNENLMRTKPTLSMKFDGESMKEEGPHSAKTEINENYQKDTKKSSSMMHELVTPHRTRTMEEQPMNERRENDSLLNENRNSCACGDDDCSLGNDLPTSYKVDRMASDGENILYTSYNDERPDIVAYCLTDDEDGEPDVGRVWRLSRIVDMIWWNTIKKFVCATNNAIYTIEYINGRFEIIRVVEDNYSHVRIAANDAHCFVHYTVDDGDTNEIEQYTTNFDFIGAIDVRNQKYLSTSSSICATNQVLASICTRRQNSRQVFQVNFFDMTLRELKWVPLGECDGSIEIRRCGNELFFISTGQDKLHIVSFDGKKQTIELQSSGNGIAVLNNRRIAVSNGSTELKLISY